MGDRTALRARTKLALAQLRQTRFDAYGKPDRKLPDCPRCEADELFCGGYFGRRFEVRCYACRLRLEFTAAESVSEVSDG